MKTGTTFLIILIALFSSINAQSQEKALIEKTINSYFDGWQTGDTIKLGKALHSSCKLKSLVDGQVQVTDRKTYLSWFTLRPKLPNTSGHIVTIDITGNTAAAKCQIKTPEVVFTDYFNMLKIKDQWYIVDKMFSRSQVK